MSPFGYNETVACEYFPLEKQTVVDHGWKWSSYDAHNQYGGDFYEPLDISQYNEKSV